MTGLTAADFRVLEDGAPQTISTFAAGEFPLAVAIGIDRSFSMGGKADRLATAKSAARTFVSAMRADDQVMVIAIGSETEVALPLSTDRAAALAAIDRLDPWGTTPLYDATLVALDAIQLLGGNGYINDYPTGRLLRDAKLYEIGAGTSEIRRMLIGRELFAETM